MHSLADPISKRTQRYPLACEPPEVPSKKYLEKLKNCRANKGSRLGPLVSVKGVKLTKCHRKPQILNISQSKTENSRDFYVKLGSRVRTDSQSLPVHSGESLVWGPFFDPSRTAAPNRILKKAARRGPKALSREAQPEALRERIISGPPAGCPTKMPCLPCPALYEYSYSYRVFSGSHRETRWTRQQICPDTKKKKKNW